VSKSGLNSLTENPENVEIDHISANSCFILLDVAEEMHSDWKVFLDCSHPCELFTERFLIVLNPAKYFSLGRMRHRAWSIKWEIGRVVYLLDEQWQILCENPLPPEQPCEMFSIS
jgi:hypothetical protein